MKTSTLSGTGDSNKQEFSCCRKTFRQELNRQAFSLPHLEFSQFMPSNFAVGARKIITKNPGSRIGLVCEVDFIIKKAESFFFRLGWCSETAWWGCCYLRSFLNWSWGNGVKIFCGKLYNKLRKIQWKFKAKENIEIQR